ncbi:MAG: helix-turn-helix domain-containing protein [Candidatus Omnitrophota bacterium]
MNSILLAKEAAKVLRVNEGFVSRLIHNKTLWAYKEGYRDGYRIAKEEVDEYIKSRLSKKNTIKK